MKTNHTPGQWVIDRAAYLKSNDLGIRSDNGSDEPMICRVINQPGMSNPEHEANARLIVSAPKLLAACQALLDYTYNTSQPCTAIRELARNAIAQATGNSTPQISENLNQPL